MKVTTFITTAFLSTAALFASAAPQWNVYSTTPVYNNQTQVGTQTISRAYDVNGLCGGENHQLQKIDTQYFNNTFRSGDITCVDDNQSQEVSQENQQPQQSRPQWDENPNPPQVIYVPVPQPVYVPRYSDVYYHRPYYYPGYYGGYYGRPGFDVSIGIGGFHGGGFYRGGRGGYSHYRGRR